MTRKRVLRAAERVLQLRGLKLTRSVSGWVISSTNDVRSWVVTEAIGPDTYDGIGFYLLGDQ